MKVLHLLFFFLFIQVLTAQQAQWNGQFSGTILGVNATLQSQSKATSWSSTIDISGYLFNLNGTINGTQCNGTMVDPQAQTNVPFEASLSGNQLTVSIVDVNPLTGLVEKMDFVFTKTNTTDTPKSGASNTLSTDNVTRDQNLIGDWRYTESYVSGEFSFATDWYMQINTDGSFLYSEGRIAGGGPNSSLDSGAGQVERGSWKSENQVIWLNDGTGWQAYARYYREGGNLMFTFGNGKSQVWEKL